MSNPSTPSVPLDPVAAYDVVAPDFHCLVSACRPYLDGVDRLILANLPLGAASLLDIGAGDARRAHGIAKAAGIAGPVLLEPSHGMRQASFTPQGYLNLRAEQLNLLTGKFDIILCLWNVFGHILPEAARLEALRQIKRLLTPNGRLFLDVNHRYNARRYGWRNTLARFLYDTLRANERNGDVVAAWNLGGRETRVRGHVFTDKELQKLIRAAGLAIDHRFVVDYTTGQLCPHPTQGNLLYIIRADGV